MKRILLFLALIAVGITATTRSTSGTRSNLLRPESMISQPGATWTYTYYPSFWRGVAIHPDDAALMNAYTYHLNYSTNTATKMTGPTYSMLAVSDYCRSEWLSSKIDPSCTSGCRTWSYYYYAGPVFTSNTFIRIFACPL